MDINGFTQLLMTFAFFHTTTGISLTGSSSYALRGQSFQFTCTVTRSPGEAFVIFNMDDKVFCTVLLRTCQQFSATQGYTCSCGQSGGYHMNITSVGLADDGEWTCEHSQISNNITLPVYWRPAQPTHNCPSWIVPGQTESCICQTSDRGNPAGAVEWLSPEHQVISLSMSSTVKLNLTSIRRSDNRRNYICRANSSLPNSNSDTTYVANIAYLDGLNITLNKQDVMENDSVTVTCTVECNPPADMTIENGNMDPVANVTKNITYTIERVQCLHNGTFNCTAKNSQARKVTSEIAQLRVKCAPRQNSKTRSDGVVYGKLKTTVSLTANVIANPLPNFTWYKSLSIQKNVAQNVSSGLSSTLIVHIKSEDDYTNYSVVVENNLGNTSLFFSLTNSEVPPGDIIPILGGVGAAVLVTLILVIIVVLHRRGFPKCNSKKKADSSGEQRGNN